MATQSPPAYNQGGSYSALSDRLHQLTGPVHSDGSLTTMGAREGFLPHRYPAYSNPSGMQVTISPFAAIVKNDFATSAGEYEGLGLSNTTVTLAASSPTLNRYDIVGIQIKDNFYDASGLNQCNVAVLQGANSAGTPSDPAIPSTFLPLVRCVVNAGVTVPTFQDLRVRTALGGTALVVADKAARDALTNPYDGQLVYRVDRKWYERYDTAWRVEGVAITSSVADRDGTNGINNPVNGQLAVTTDTGLLWERVGGVWVPVSGETVQYQRSTNLTLLTNTVTKLSFDVPVLTNTAFVTVSGNQDFALQREGRWLLQCTVPIETASSGVNSYWAWIGSSSNSAVRYAVMTSGNNGFHAILEPNKVNKFTGTPPTVSVYAYQDSGVNRNVELTQSAIDITLTYLGP